MTSHPIETVTHGRVLVEDTAGARSDRLLVAFHGYGHNAEIMLEDVRRIPGVAEQWRVASVQGLHRFYARDQTVVSSWMTRQDRELAIADNLAYVDRAVEAAGGGDARVIVFVGFSQGAAMAYRAALGGRRAAAGIIALAGDIPPDVQADVGHRWPPVLLGAGARDTWYAADKLAADDMFLTSRGIARDIVRYDGGHEWTDEFRLAAGRWLESVSAG